MSQRRAQECRRQRALPLLIWAAPLMFFSACVQGEALSVRANTVSQQIDEAHNSAYRCAEEALAIAHAELAFLQEELAYGDPHRAREHLERVDEVKQKIFAADLRPECQDDTDRDGIPDRADRCPNDPEDFDQFEDEDGCPEDQDTDGDGIKDSRDNCPEIPEDLDGDDDEDGCPDLLQDRDGDGILDEQDRCPLKPEDADGFEDEDGCPDLDNDRDGVLDRVDSCPMQPEDRDAFEDEDGCPDPDNDNDRILDESDQCPLEPEDYDNDSDDDGCPDLYKNIVVRDDRIELRQTIHFATNSDRILSRSHDLLNEVAQALRDNEEIKVSIEGHTDSKGSDRYNLDLSKRRAASVMRYLVSQGVSSSRMSSTGYGESRPIEDNRTRDGRAANRRVEFLIVGR